MLGFPIHGLLPTSSLKGLANAGSPPASSCRAGRALESDKPWVVINGPRAAIMYCIPYRAGVPSFPEAADANESRSLKDPSKPRMHTFSFLGKN